MFDFMVRRKGSNDPGALVFHVDRLGVVCGELEGDGFRFLEWGDAAFAGFVVARSPFEAFMGGARSEEHPPHGS